MIRCVGLRVTGAKDRYNNTWTDPRIDRLWPPTVLTKYRRDVRSATVAVVVPAYDEFGLVGGVIETMPSYVDSAYAVEGSSADGTEIRATTRRVNTETEPDAEFARRVVPLRHEENRGVSGAIKTGYLAARNSRQCGGGDEWRRTDAARTAGRRHRPTVGTWPYSCNIPSRRTP